MRPGRLDLEAIGLDRDAGQDRVDERASGGLSPAMRELLVVFSSNYY
jgi:hypothetical protein